MDGLMPACAECTKAKAQARRSTAEHKAWKKNSDLKRKYGITLDEYNAMHEAQGGVCAICHSDEPIKTQPLAVDHCHTTHRVRGLLCSNCNMGLGKFMDNKYIIEKAVKYLAVPLY